MLCHTLVVRCRLFSVSGWFWSRYGGFFSFFFFSIFFLTTLKKREGWKIQRSPNTHDWTRSRLSREIRKALEFCFGRAKLEHYSIILLQSKRNRLKLFIRRLNREKHKRLSNLNAFLPREYHTSVAKYMSLIKCNYAQDRRVTKYWDPHEVTGAFTRTTILTV